MARAKAYDAAVLQKAADNALHTNLLGQPGNAGAQAANASDEQFDFHACAAGGIERVDHFTIHQRIHLGPNRRRAPCPRMLDLLCDQPQQGRL